MFFLVNVFMDIAALLAAGVCCNRKIHILKILLVSGGAAAGTICLLLFVPCYGLYVILVHVLLNPFMIWIAFRPGDWWDFFRLLLAVYFVLFVAGGVQQSLRWQFGMNMSGQILFSGLLAVGGFVIWQLRQKVLQRVCLVELELAGKTVSLKAFCDSGNLLRDPDSGKAVSILEKSVFLSGWERQLEIEKQIPFCTIGKEGSMLEVITLDKMRIFQKGSIREVETPLIGLHDGKLMSNPQVQMLLNGAFC